MDAGQNAFLRYDFPSASAERCAGRLGLLFEVFRPKPLLVIFGGGHVGRSLMRLARPTGFRILLFDDREKTQIPEAVSLADRFVRVPEIERGILQEPVPAGAFFVLCGHDHAADGEVLSAALQKDARYIGMLASRRKIDALFSQLKRRGFTDEQLNNVHSPIGLDLGGESPQELAVGILAQILLVKNKKG